MAAKKKEVRKVEPEVTTGEFSQVVVDLYVPEKGKKTRFIEGSSTEAARELVRALREDVSVF